MDTRVAEIVKDVRAKKIVTENHSLSHVFIKGECINILKSFPNKKIDLIITDPPYNVGLNYGLYFKDKKPWDEYFEWCICWLKECERVLSDRGSMYLISYPEINGELLHYIRKYTNLQMKRWITWHYPTNIGHSKNNWTRSQRSILFLTKSNDYVFNREDNIVQPYKNPDVGKIKKLIADGKKGRTSYDLLTFFDMLELKQDIRADVLQINLLKNISKDRKGSMDKNAKDHHPCQLPLSLLRILVKVSSNPRSIILDPFAGTFTLSKVAVELNRSSIGIELNPDYIKLGIDRLKSK